MRDAGPGSGSRDPRSGMRDPASGMRDPASGMRDPASGMRDPGPLSRWATVGMHGTVRTCAEVRAVHSRDHNSQ